MKTKLQRFAPFGLYLAIFALVIAIGAYILQQQFSLTVQISLLVAVLGLAASIFMDPEGARSILTGRQAKYGSNALLLSLGFLGILILVNYLVFNNDKRKDLTENQENSLSSETVEIISALKQPVTAKAFYTQRNQSLETAQNMLRLFEQESNGLFTYEVIDPEVDPVAAQQANVTRDGDIVLFNADRQVKATYSNEQGVASAVVKLVSSGTQKVYFVTGHGEYDPMVAGDRSYSSIKQTLESKNYDVTTINLLTVSSIPEDANAVVVAGPTKSLTENEVQILKEYFDAGGSLIIMLDPSLFTELDAYPDALISYLSQDLGIQVNDDLVIDLVGQSQLGQPLLAVGASYATHPITQGLTNFATVFPQARSLEIIENPNGITPQKIVNTQEQSWGETDLAGLKNGGQPEPNQDLDNFGPLAIMVSAENSTTNSRIVVVGDSDYASNANVSAFGNKDLFVNSLDWVVGQEDLIQLTPKDETSRSLNLPPVPYISGLIILVAIFVLPGIVLAAGIGVAISRRRHS